MTLLCTVIAQFHPIKLDGIDPFRPEVWLYCVAAEGTMMWWPVICGASILPGMLLFCTAHRENILLCCSCGVDVVV